MRSRIPGGAGLLVACVAAAPAAAQESGRYVPVSSWAMPYVEHLIRAGVLQGLDPLTRPLRRADLARALAAVDTLAAAPAVRGTLARLAREFADPPADSARWSLEVTAGLLGASDARRWILRPSADSAGVFPRGGLAAAVELPHLALVTSPGIENRLRYDPDYTGKKNRFVAGRNPDTYVVTSWRYFEAFVGQTDRNWGSPEIEGLILSPSPYTVDHLFVRLGPPRLRLELVTTQLDPLPLIGTTQPVNRYLATHRVVVQPTARLALSLFESAVYAQSGGVPRSWEPWFLNPLNLFLLSQYDGGPTANFLVGADAAWRARGSLALYGQVYLDDVQVDDQVASDQEPPAYGLTLAASGALRGGTLTWTALYTRVMNLSYRTPAREEQYTLRGVGIGRNFSDYDQTTARVTALARPGLLVTGEVSYLRQGEGDMRLPYPPVVAYDDSLNFLTGVVQRTVYAGAGASWTLPYGVHLRAEVGRHAARNAGHVAGARDGRWVWRLGVDVRRRFRGVVRP